MNHLDYEYHYEEYSRLIGTQDAKSRRYAELRAQEAHNRYVHDALRDEQTKNIALSQQLKEPQAQYYARFGIGRRAGMLWSAFRSILQIVHVGRTKPLSSDDVKTVSRDLNTIYINVVGTIDNYAWCLLHERGSVEIKSLAATRIGLFARDFLNDPSMASLRTSLTPYVPWFAELRSRRDPAAHRIPLSVPPAVLLPEESRRYQAIEQEVGDAIGRKEFDRAEQLWAEQEALGAFLPKFLHDPGKDLIPFYPTIPQDLAQLVRVSDAVRQFLS